MKKIPFQFPENALNLAAFELCREIALHGFECRMVGGCVRDAYLGLDVKDIDLVIGAEPEDLRRIFPEIKLVGAAFGVFLLEYKDCSFEIACGRSERQYLDGRHPESVKFTRDLALDVLRRDFTVNGLLYDPVSREIIDHVNGIEDLQRGIIRTIGIPEERFSEDYLRMLRAVRFAGRLKFEIEANTFEAIRSLASKTSLLAPERVGAELTMMLVNANAADAFSLMLEAGLLTVVLPEIAAMKGVEQSPEYHPEGDVWTHTMIMLSLLHAPSPELGWSVLLHDVGKKAVQTFEESGRIRFFGHETKGEETSREILVHFRFSNSFIDKVSIAIANHMRFGSVLSMKPGKVKKLAGRENFPMELELHRIDCFSSHRKMDVYLFLLDFVAAQNGVTELPKPFVSGRDLLDCGLRPGPEFGQILEDCFDRQLAGEFESREDAVKFLRTTLAKKHPNTAGK